MEHSRPVLTMMDLTFVPAGMVSKLLGHHASTRTSAAQERPDALSTQAVSTIKGLIDVSVKKGGSYSITSARISMNVHPANLPVPRVRGARTRTDLTSVPGSLLYADQTKYSLLTEHANPRSFLCVKESSAGVVLFVILMPQGSLVKISMNVHCRLPNAKQAKYV